MVLAQNLNFFAYPSSNPDFTGSERTCQICQLSFKDGELLTFLPCTYKHTFHKDCALSVFSNSTADSCPICMQTVTV